MKCKCTTVTGALALILAVSLYLSLLDAARSACSIARADTQRTLARAAQDTYDAYAACAWDSEHGYCGIPATGRSSVSISTYRPTNGAWAYTEIPEGAWCAFVHALPNPLSIVAEAAATAVTPPPGTVDVVVSRARLLAFDTTVAQFRRQCECGWPGWRYDAAFEFKVTFELVRTGLTAHAFQDELRRAAVFYDKFGGAVESWVDSVRQGTERQMMSDHGTLHRFEPRCSSIIIRYILVIYSGDVPAPVSVASDVSGGWVIWFGSSPSTTPRSANGTFTVGMSETQITAKPSGDCDCTHDAALHQRLRESVDARMKKYFADTARHVIRAVPDQFEAVVGAP